ncbi:hypothetical protein EMCRGX_G012789 [Ephydatia muelleri]
MFQCPICERNTSLPVGMAIVFPQNLHLGSEVDVALYTSKMVNNSDVCCDECVDGRYDLADVLKPREHDCSQPNHEDNNLIAYCETCSLLLRRDCTTATHKSHTVKEISTVAKNRQKEITGALDHAKETTALTLQKEKFEKMVGDIGHYTDMASHILQTHTDHEIVALGGLIPTELQATLKRVQTNTAT